MNRTVLAGWLLLIVILLSPCTASPVTYCLPENGSLLFGAYTPDPASVPGVLTGDSIAGFSRLVGKTPGIIAISDEWGDDMLFPEQQADLVRKSGATPYIRLMLRSALTEYTAEPLYSFDNIANGKFDTNLRHWARAARAFGTPVVVEYGTEVNGWWYPWNGYWNGGARGTDGFIAAYRHIITLMEEEGADNIIWVYHVAASSLPDESWNTLSSYYPGDGYIDWVGVSVYGAKSPYGTGTRSFGEQMDRVYPDILGFAPEKPVLICEMGTDMRNQAENPVTWIQEALVGLQSDSWPSVFGIVWWNDGWQNDNNPLHDTSLRIEDNEEVLSVFKEEIGSGSVYISKPAC